MGKDTARNIKLGIFILAAIAFFIVMLYVIGSNRNLFGRTFELKAAFRDVSGLMEGNNVRYAGIDVGTVDKIYISNDSTVTVLMIIEEEYQSYIRKNAIASIATDGLMGNKLVNITNSPEAAAHVNEGDVLQTLTPVDAGEMVRTLKQTNDNLMAITYDVQVITGRINNSNNLWSMLMDSTVSQNLKQTITNIKMASRNTGDMIQNINTLVADARKGKGSLGRLVSDTTLARRMKDAMEGFNALDDSLSILIQQLNSVALEISHDKGTIGTLLRDTTVVHDFKESLESIKKGAEGFNQNMEALKHSTFFRRYFRKMQKANKKAP